MVESDEVPMCVQVDHGEELIKFKSSTLFQSSVITFLVRLKSDKEDLSNLRKIFTSMDKD